MFALLIQESKEKKNTTITSGSPRTERLLPHNRFCGGNKALLQRKSTLKYPKRDWKKKKYPQDSASSLMLAMGQIVQLESVTLSAKVI